MTGKSAKNKLTFFHRGLKKYRQRKYAEALSLLKKQLKIAPSFLPCYYYIGRINFDLKDYQQALAYLSICHQERPEHNSILYYLGRCYLLLNQPEQAVQYLKDCRGKMGWEKFFTGLAYYNLNQFEMSHHFLKDVSRQLLHYKKVRLVYSAVLFNLGNLYYNEQQIEKAESFFLQSIQIYPAAYPAYFQLGSLNIEKKDYKAALYYLEKLNVNFKKNKALNLALVYLYHETQQSEKLEKKLKQAAYQVTSLTEFQFKKIMALTLFRNQKYKEAIPLFLQLYQKKQFNEYTLFYLAQCRIKTGEFKRAFNCFRLIFEISPAHIMINNSYLLLLIQYQQFDQARKMGEHFIQRKYYNQKTLLYYYYSAVFSQSLDRFEPLFQKLKPLFSRHNMFLEATARYFLDHNQMDKAMFYYYRLYNLIPRDQHTISELINLFINRKLYHQALYYLKKMHQLSPDNATVCFYYAFFLIKQGLIEESITILKKIKDNQGDAYYLMAEAYLKLDQFKKGLTCLKKSFLCNPLSLPVQYRSLALFYRLKKYQSCLRLCLLMKRTHQEFKRVYVYETMVYIRLKQYEKALHQLDHYCSLYPLKPPYFLMLHGFLCYLAGKTDQAYQKAVEYIQKFRIQAAPLTLLALCLRRKYQDKKVRRIEGMLAVQFKDLPLVLEYQQKYIQPGQTNLARSDLGLRLPCN